MKFIDECRKKEKEQSEDERGSEVKVEVMVRERKTEPPMNQGEPPFVKNAMS